MRYCPSVGNFYPEDLAYPEENLPPDLITLEPGIWEKWTQAPLGSKIEVDAKGKQTVVPPLVSPPPPVSTTKEPALSSPPAPQPEPAPTAKPKPKGKASKGNTQ